MDYFYQFSIGNIGLLKKWFKRALWKALMSEERILTRDILHSTRWSNRSLGLMLSEAKLGESQLEDIGDDLIARELGLEVTPSIDVVTGNFNSDDKNPGSSKKKTAKGNRHPGRRGPSRDPVGGIPHAA